jgi:hypothetical protein
MQTAAAAGWMIKNYTVLNPLPLSCLRKESSQHKERLIICKIASNPAGRNMVY